MESLFPGVAPLPVDLIHDLAPEENQEVEQGDDRQQGAEPGSLGKRGDDVHGEEGQVRRRQPFGLYGNDVQKHQTGVGVQRGEGKEHGHAHIIGPHQHAVAKGVMTDDPRQDGQDHAGEVVQIELRRTPLPLQHGADEVHEIQG